MYWRLYKLRFLTPVRFGADERGAGLDQGRLACHADTLFSALCQEAADDAALLAALVRAAQSGALLFTDMLPFRGQTLYVPRPYLPPAGAARRRERSLADVRRYAMQQKKVKRLSYIAVRQLPAYLNWLRHGGEFPLAAAKWGDFVETDKVKCRGAAPQPYQVTAFQFRAGDDNNLCGLYFVAAAQDEDMFGVVDTLVDRLGIAGLGGKRSAGYGKFTLAEDPIDMDSEGLYADDASLFNLLTAADATWYMALSVVWPTAEDAASLAEAYYTLVERSGFVNDPAYAPQAVKRHNVHMLSAGSCVRHKLAGQLGDVAAGGNHPIYRYGKGIYMGLSV